MRDDPAERERLRRIYGPDASTAVDRPRSGTRRPRRRLLLVAGALVLLVAAALTIRALVPLTAAPPRPAVVATDAGTRQELTDALATGGAAGIAAWLVTHPSPRSLRSATRFVTVESSGTGALTVPLAPEGVGDGAGRATVLLVLGQDASATWTAVAPGAGGRALATRGGPQRAGVLTATTLRYPSGERPARLRIDAPATVAWGVAVVYSD